MPRWSGRRERFRAILSGKRCVHPGSVFDPISARIAEDLGFELGMFAGSIASQAVLGAPDVIALTLTEFAHQAYRICRAGNLPLLCDADHGYGNAINVMRTVEELEVAGVAALSIEDTALPQPFGSKGKAQLTSIEEGAGKMRAAIEARRDPGLVIAGRTSAASITNVADAIQRAKAYAVAGVDAIFLVGVKTRADLDAIAAEIKLPLILGGPGKELLDLPYLGERGVRVCLQGHQPFMAAVRAVYDTLKALREGTPADRLEGIAGDELMKRLMRSDDYARWGKDYLWAPAGSNPASLGLPSLLRGLLGAGNLFRRAKPQTQTSMRGGDMKLFRDSGKRVHRVETPVVTYLSREEAIGLAQLATETAGLRWDEPISAGARRDETEAVVVWTVVTNALRRGAHVRVRIDDTTGTTIEVEKVVI